MSYDISFIKSSKKLKSRDLLRAIELLEQQDALRVERNNLQISQSDFNEQISKLNSDIGKVLLPAAEFHPFFSNLQGWLDIESEVAEKFLEPIESHPDWAYMNAKVDLTNSELHQVMRLAERFSIQVFSHPTGKFIKKEDLELSNTPKSKGCMTLVTGCFGLIQFILLALIFLSPLVFGLIDFFLADNPELGKVMIVIGIPLAILFAVVVYKGWLKYFPLDRIIIELLTHM